MSLSESKTLRILHTIMPGPFAEQFQQSLTNLNDAATHTIAIIGKSISVFQTPARHINLNSEEDLQHLHQLIEETDVWYMHRYFKNFAPFVHQYIDQKTVILQTWGPDYLQFCNWNYLDRETRACLRKDDSTPLLRKAYRKIYWRISNQQHIRTLRTLDGTCFAAPVEAKFASSKLKLHNTREWRYIYEDIPSYKGYQRTHLLKVQLGNCSDQDQNHLDALSKIALNEEFNEILIPLSYGRGSQRYIETVAQKASHLKPKTTILTELLPQLEFQNTINSFNILVLANIRQQALGNLVLGIAQGKTIVLHEQGHNALFCSMLGIHYLSLESLSTFSKEYLFTQEQADHNYKALASYWSKTFNQQTTREVRMIHDRKKNLINH